MVLRPMVEVDVEAVLDVQEPGAVKALASVFPQDRYPFPRDDLRDRWRREIHDSRIGCYVIEQGNRIAGFVALRGDELLHFGVAVDNWGSGLASVAHDETIAILANDGVRSARLRVFEANGRARRFYEKHGWVTAGERSFSAFPPHPALLQYELLIIVQPDPLSGD